MRLIDACWTPSVGFALVRNRQKLIIALLKSYEIAVRKYECYNYETSTNNPSVSPENFHE